MNITVSEARFESTSGLCDIYTKIWMPQNPKALLQICHGVSEHIGRYEEFARFMALRGFGVFGCDSIGHGQTCATMLQLGDFSDDDDDVRLVDDANRLRHIMTKRYPDLPYFMLGQDMGSLIVRLHASLFPDGLDGIILASPTAAPQALTALEPVADIASSLIDRNMYADKAKDLFEKITSKRLGEDDSLAWISKSLDNRERRDEDPYVDFPINYGSAINLLKLLFKVSGDSWFVSYPPDLPVFIIAGSQDAASMFGSSAVKLADRFEKFGTEAEIKQYPGLRHDIFNEDSKEVIFGDVLNFLEHCLKKGRTE